MNTTQYDTLTTVLTGHLFAVVLVAPALALLASLLLLRLYRRVVMRSMSARAGSSRTAQRTPGTPVPEREQFAAGGVPAEVLYAGATRKPWRAAAVYAIAGSCYAAVMAAAYIVAWGVGFLPLRYLFLAWIFVWPVVLTVNLVASATRRARLATASIYFLVLATLGAIAIARSPEFGWGQVVVLWLINDGLASVLLLAFLNRRVRAVGPLVLILMIFAVTGSILTIAVASSSDAVLNSIVSFGLSLGLSGPDIFILLTLAGFAASGLLGWPALAWIRNQYEKKKVSDQSITLDAIWLLFGIAQSIPLVFEGPAWILSGLVAFAVYKVVAWAGLPLLIRERDPARKKSARLLVLRVFSLGRRSEKLFDALTKHWRYVGSVRLIAGPDLATTTIEPHEFLDFIGGRLARRFIDGAETLELRLSEEDDEPDRDGRFRVNDFFCHDDTWRMVLSRLAGGSDAVLMDLRGFSPQNAGVIYEINALINLVPLEKVVFVVDGTTDEPFLRQTARECWDRIRPTSPNRSSSPEQLPLLRFEGSGGGDLRGLLRAVCAAAGKKGSATIPSRAGSGERASVPPAAPS